MSSSLAPSEYFEGIGFNLSFYTLASDSVTLEYINANFLKSTGINDDYYKAPSSENLLRQVSEYDGNLQFIDSQLSRLYEKMSEILTFPF